MFTEALKGKVFDVVADTAHELGCEFVAEEYPL